MSIVGVPERTPPSETPSTISRRDSSTRPVVVRGRAQVDAWIVPLHAPRLRLTKPRWLIMTPARRHLGGRLNWDCRRRAPRRRFRRRARSYKTPGVGLAHSRTRAWRRPNAPLAAPTVYKTPPTRVDVASPDPPVSPSTHRSSSWMRYAAPRDPHRSASTPPSTSPLSSFHSPAHFQIVTSPRAGTSVPRRLARARHRAVERVRDVVLHYSPWSA